MLHIQHIKYITQGDATGSDKEINAHLVPLVRWKKRIFPHYAEIGPDHFKTWPFNVPLSGFATKACKLFDPKCTDTRRSILISFFFFAVMITYTPLGSHFKVWLWGFTNLHSKQDAVLYEMQVNAVFTNLLCLVFQKSNVQNTENAKQARAWSAEMTEVTRISNRGCYCSPTLLFCSCCLCRIS